MHFLLYHVWCFIKFDHVYYPLCLCFIIPCFLWFPLSYPVISACSTTGHGLDLKVWRRTARRRAQQQRMLRWNHNNWIPQKLSKTNKCSWKHKDKFIGGPHFSKNVGNKNPWHWTLGHCLSIFFVWIVHRQEIDQVQVGFFGRFAILPSSGEGRELWLLQVAPIFSMKSMNNGESWGAIECRSLFVSCYFHLVNPWSTS